MDVYDDEIEVEKLKKDIGNLTRFCRGEEVEGISLKMFEDLEETLEMAVKCVQSRQREIFSNQINILQNQENMALKENAELQNQIEEIYRHTGPRRYCELVDIQEDYPENINSEATGTSKNRQSSYANEELHDFETFLTLGL
nr:AGAMOUS-like 18 protein [Larix kaempferi]